MDLDDQTFAEIGSFLVPPQNNKRQLDDSHMKQGS